MSNDESTSLILPGQSAPDTQDVAHLPPVVWLRNPKTGVIYKFLRPANDDTIGRCLKDGYTHSSEHAARAQAVELARLQGRPLPPWAEQEHEEPVAETPAAPLPSAARLASKR